ncbi:MAG: relaxase/mobilization nuclease domain-containing protein [Plesiomonas sp.]
MIVKFHPRGIGRGSGPVEYLLGRDLQREGATLNRGDPAEIMALIDSSPYAKKYTSGVLSFAEVDLSRETKDKIMSDFEKMLLPGLDADQYACLWVEHRDKTRLELNFVIPNIELTSGKRLQPYYEKADKLRVNAWKIGVNAQHRFHDPDDPINRRELVTPRHLPLDTQKAARAITDGLLQLIHADKINDRNGLVCALSRAGFEVVRQTKNSISIANPDGGRNIRLKGMIYEQNFRFGEGLRGEIEAASSRYREQSETRILEARAICARGIELKRGQNQKRYKRPERDYEPFGAEVMDLDRGDSNNRFRSDSGGSLVAGGENSLEHAANTVAGENIAGLGEAGSENSAQQLQPAVVRPDRRDSAELSGWLQDFEGVLNDGIRATVTKISDRINRTARTATRSICQHVHRFRAVLQNDTAGKRSFETECAAVDRACGKIESAIAAVEQIARSKTRGMHR